MEADEAAESRTEDASATEVNLSYFGGKLILFRWYVMNRRDCLTELFGPVRNYSLFFQNKSGTNGADRAERDERNGRDRDRGASETRSKPPADRR